MIFLDVFRIQPLAFKEINCSKKIIPFFLLMIFIIIMTFDSDIKILIFTQNFKFYNFAQNLLY